MDDALDFLQSRPLIGFQMDGSHLNTVLQNIIRQQQQLVQGQRQVMQRVDELEENVSDLRSRHQEVERVLEQVSGAVDPSFYNDVRVRLQDLEGAMDHVVRDVDEARKTASAAGQDADQAGRLADQANRGLVPLQESVQSVAQDVEGLARQSAQERRDIGRALDDLTNARNEQDRHFADALRSLQQRADQLARESGVERLRQMLEELSDRTDENFRNVEESARAVDAELNRQGGELGNILNELGAADERQRSRFTAFATDMDDKYQALLNAFREYERSATELEEHVAMAGQALARRRRNSPGRSAGSGLR